MKWRNQILALLCLTIFIALGVLYFRHWVVQKPFGIVLFIGEGLTPDRVAATRLYAGGANPHLAIESLPAVAMLSNYSQDFAVPDEAAAATTLATGVKVNNRSLGVGPNDKRLTKHHRPCPEERAGDRVGDKRPPDGPDRGGLLRDEQRRGGHRPTTSGRKEDRHRAGRRRLEISSRSQRRRAHRWPRPGPRDATQRLRDRSHQG